MTTTTIKASILTLIMTLAIPLTSSAKVEDFNAMIAENAHSQDALRVELKEQMNETRQAQMRSPRNQIVEVASDWKSFNTSTSKSLLTFDKEKVDHRASAAKQQERLATELSDLERSF
ncbi:MAG: hypothetical protein EOP06_21320 [Proteobacteria bacterium]|nr:MAG: hypothetical protein EOP06_21320 [Pseudomonadota bacterium]